jgi:small-conductance mechanosensitive channel
MNQAGPEDEPPEPRGTLRPTSPRALTACVVVGLALGWGIHPLMSRIAGRAPLISWSQALALVLVAVIMCFLAWHTWQTVQVRGERLEPHQSVNRLVLARACALGGALITAGYVGYAVSWLGDAAQYADRWILRSVVAALGAGVVTLASLALERACRTDGGDPRA